MSHVRTHPVYFVLLPNTLLLDAAGPAEALRLANRYQCEIRFVLRYIGPHAAVATSIGLELSGVEPLPDALPGDAMVVVAGAVSDPIAIAHTLTKPAVLEARRIVAGWLRRIARPSHRLVFICSGAMLAGEAGLLDGRSCTTHHDDCGALEKLVPTARVLANRIFVSDGNVHTSAGVTAGLDLMLQTIAELTTPLCAVAVARDMVVYMRRAGGDPQISPWLDGRNHVHPALHRVQDAIVADPAHPWSNDELATLAYTSPRHLARLFHAYAGMSPLDYIHRLRVSLARELIANSQLDLEHVAERAGFGSGRQLRRVWRKYNDSPPARLRGIGRA